VLMEIKRVCAEKEFPSGRADDCIRDGLLCPNPLIYRAESLATDVPQSRMKRMGN